MKRREFITGSLAASALAGVSSLATAAEKGQTTERDYYELRAYRLKAGANHDLLDNYLQTAAIPAWNRLGIKSVGVFTEMEPPVVTFPGSSEKPAKIEGPSPLWILIPHPSLESFSTAWSRINADAEYQKAGESYLKTAKTEAAFERIDSWLLLAFAGMHALGIGSNIMSLGGIAIALGAMVDAAIVMIENAHKHLERAEPGDGDLAALLCQLALDGVDHRLQGVLSRTAISVEVHCERFDQLALVHCFPP